jgi:TRAP-type transport system periplasmic protein
VCGGCKALSLNKKKNGAGSALQFKSSYQGEKMKKSVVSIACLTAAIGLSPLAAVAQNQVTLTASSWLPPTHVLSQTQAKWCDEVAKATATRVKCNILPKSVTAAPGTFDAVRDGLADLSYTVHGYTPGRFLLSQLAELPFLGDNAEATSVAYNRIYEKHFAAVGEHKGVKTLAVFTHGPGMILNVKKSIAAVGDLQGLKFRVGGGMVNEIGKTLNMNLTLKPAPESYELLSSGVMDGVLFPAESVESFRLDKLIKHRTTFPGGLYNTSFVFMMNEAAWNKIGKEDQAAITKLSGEAAARMFGRGWDGVDRRAVALMQANNVQSVQANAGFVKDVKDKTALLESKWVTDATAKGLPNAAAIVKEFRSEIAKN